MWFCEDFNCPVSALVRVSSMPFGKGRIFDRPADAEGKGQLAVYQCGSRQTSESVGEEVLLRSDLGETAILEFVGAGDANAARAVDIDSVAIDIDGPAGELEYSGFAQ